MPRSAININVGEGYSGTEKSQSAMICLNPNFFGGGIQELKSDGILLSYRVSLVHKK